MINEERTLKDFGYTSDTLKHKSNKLIWRICEGCGKETKVYYFNYTFGQILCQSCSSKGVNNSFYGKKHSDESLAKMSKGHTGDNNPNTGKIFSLETRKKMSVSAIGKVMSLESRKKMSESHIGSVQSLKSRQRKSATLQNIPYDEWEAFAVKNEYCPLFNNTVRELIRDKYNRQCFICGILEEDNITSSGKQRKLSVHHVDMNKQQGCDTHEWKLIPLCVHCHGLAHGKVMISYIEYILKDEDLI